MKLVLRTQAVEMNKLSAIQLKTVRGTEIIVKSLSLYQGRRDVSSLAKEKGVQLYE